MTVAIIGAGVMGETLLSGLIRGGSRRRRPDRRGEASRAGDRAPREVRRRRWSPSTEVAAAETVVLVVKPQDMGDVLAEIAPHLRGRAAVDQPGRRHHHRLHREAPPRRDRRRPGDAQHARARRRGHGRDLAGHPLRRGAPRASPSRCSRSPVASSACRRSSRTRSRRSPGSGPAYLFFVVEAMIEAGVHLGLPRSTATELVVQTVVGSAKLLRETGEHPTVLRERVTSPGRYDGRGDPAARGPQGARRVHHGDGGRARPLDRPRRQR